MDPFIPRAFCLESEHRPYFSFNRSLGIMVVV